MLQRSGGYCKCCLVNENDTLIPHEPDHIIAEQHGGPTTAENLAFACFHCNRSKGPNIASVDPQTGNIVPLFHPRRDDWQMHFRLEGAVIVPQTPQGRATVDLLRFNSPERLQAREALVQAGRYPVPRSAVDHDLADAGQAQRT